MLSCFIDQCKFLISKTDVMGNHDIIPNLLRLGCTSQDTGDHTIPQDPVESHLSQGLPELGGHIIQGQDLL